MGKNIVSHKLQLSIHKEHEILLKLESAELADAKAEATIESKDNELAVKVVPYIQRYSYEATKSQKFARAILGKNFFGVEEWSSLYRVRFSKKQLREAAEFPWGDDILNAPCRFVNGKTVKETHFAFLGFDRLKGKPLTILKFHELHPASGQPRFYSANDPWYAKHKFATEVTCRFRWYLMPLEILPNSTEKTYEEQEAMLSSKYEVPLAIEEVTKNILYYRKNGIYLNSTRWGRCRDVTSIGDRIRVGRFNADGLGVCRYWDEYRHYFFGVAASCL